MRTHRLTCAAVCVFLSCLEILQFAHAQSVDHLRRNFMSPPGTAKPRLWWDWMNGNVTKKGIEKDLSWMQRIGIGGLQAFDVASDTPKVVQKRLVFMGPPWRDAFRFAAKSADRLGMELAIAGSPGWSESGGPWVRPRDAMKKLVWSEVTIEGGHAYVGKLPHPPTTVGPFQNVEIDRGELLSGSAPVGSLKEYYEDIAVVAYRVPEAESSMEELNPRVTTSGARAVKGDLLWDGDLSHDISIPFAPEGEGAWVQYVFDQPRTIQALSLVAPSSRSYIPLRTPAAVLQASADGVSFIHVVDVPPLPDVEQTVSFAPVTARIFRLLLPRPPPLPANLVQFVSPLPKEHQLAEFRLYTTPRTDHFEQKAAFFIGKGLDESPRSNTPSCVDAAIHSKDVLDVSANLRADGSFSWTPPPGRWTVLRLGYSLLGVTNHPASPAGTGLEVDKLDRVAVRSYMNHYLDQYRLTVGLGLMGRHGIRAMINDSWEAGAQNWTRSLPEEFARRRGYDLRGWFPALTGRVISSCADTERFLWDFRRTLGELVTESHYAQITATLHERGMIHYGESHEYGRNIVADGMDVKRTTDIPMGAMWTTPDFASLDDYDLDIRESASVAHIYGQNLVAAESFTTMAANGSAYTYAPEMLKPTADRELVDGLNLFVIHTSVHQPNDSPGPGVTLGPFGQWFTRNETWAEEAAPWVEYLARSSYLLQQGHFVADVLYYYGQDSNVTALFADHPPPVPDGYAYDFASAHALTQLSVSDGTLVTESGMRYRILALAPRARLMSLDVLRRIAELAATGATIVGDKPEATPSLSDDPAVFADLAQQLWGSGGSVSHRYGKGLILSGRSLADSLQELAIKPDFGYSSPFSDTTLRFVHRQLANGDLYFVSNRKERTESVEARFRVKGRAPELWHADTGAIEPAAYSTDHDFTLVPLVLGPGDAQFVVFRQPTRQAARKVSLPVRKLISTVSGPWRVRFQSGRGAPEETTYSALRSWTESANPGIRYFSGTATYEKSLNAPPAWFKTSDRLEIDLGGVRNVAEIVVNGVSAGILWKPPFRADVSALLHRGRNCLAVRVTNLWPNRLIGDRQPGATPVAVTTFNPYNARSPLLESGLIGPVKIVGVGPED